MKTGDISLLVLEEHSAEAESLAEALDRAGFTSVWLYAADETTFRSQLEKPHDAVLLFDSLSALAPGQVLGIVREEKPELPVIVMASGEPLDAGWVDQGAADCWKRNDPAGVVKSVQLALDENQRWREKRQAEDGFLEGIRIGSFRVTPSGRIVDASPALAEILGYPNREALLNENLMRLCVDAEECWLWKKWLQRAGHVNNFEMRYHRYDREIIWSEVSARVVYTSDGQERFYQGHLMDITVRKQTEISVLRNEQRYRGLFQDAPGMYVITNDRSGKPVIEDCNAAFLNVLGYTRTQILGKPLSDFYAPDSWAKLMGSGYEQALRGTFTPQEHELIGRDARRIKTMAHAMPEQDNTGQICGIRLMYMDMTERKRVESALLLSQKLAGMNTLAAGVAHELNSPLQVITGRCARLLKMLEQGKQPDVEELHRQISILERNAWRCAAVTKSLQIYAQELSGQLSPCGINSLVMDALSQIEEDVLDPRKIHMEQIFGEELHDLYCDRDQIVQLLVHLLKNACEAMPDGGDLMIRTRQDPDLHLLKVQIMDTGVGIPAELLEKIFDPFFTTKPVGQGIGMGLSMALGIMQAYGGDISVDSSPGLGAVFTLSFPYEESEKGHSASHGRFNITPDGRYGEGAGPTSIEI